MHQFGEHLQVRFRIRQAGFGVTGVNAQRVIHGAIERGRIQQKFRIGALQMARWLQ